MNTPTSPASNPNAINEVAAAVEQLRKAMISADGAVLDRLAHDELSYGHSGGQMQNKQEFIASFTSGDSVFVDIEITGQTVSIVGNTAIVRHILSASTNDKGKGPGSVKIGILLVWVGKDKQAWQLLARQAVRV
ncbi:nuclear transport factor 2 family protein [Mucilaginibacter sp.]|uniref:nuclear transport factor 2 family protein n=1 Tax=Mucilaginibacter sp. TaxID=1882438 RepID=UPI0028516451|nr:nuclear transport factor 2 family protein [Mucilaginibacter sp.]MDR3696147.1 nuclear transport factor 2 family protein [Mucilaginibacter sp.]